jgi:Family of unknown function (DUF6444)
MERSEAEAIYDAGREACVEFLLELSARHEAQIKRLEERIRRLEERTRQSSRNSSKPPSSDPPKTRQRRRAEARSKAKEILRGAVANPVIGGRPASLPPRTNSTRSSTATPSAAVVRH